ncbi:ModD protein [Rhodocyclus tenuis]|uniref:Putative pyrophosphorylase ModD n=1 Tax=Rhodocyclus tenuis TaxID=1066 RepID=A0A840GKI4_RHOTE|nr:ModD protein [Rhodocyclus tenuis]MBB4248669.1 molybdenum transport protein [Rhodocyclus tenuis]
MRAPVLGDDALLRLLEDDVGGGDLSTEALAIGGQRGSLGFYARQAMTVCAVEEAARLFALAGARVAAGAAVSGQLLAPGDRFLEVSGSAESLHRVWKTAQVLVEWASGIASAASALVAAAGDVPVACTRKNVPGTKTLSVKAVRAGGATMHRLGLSETLLLFAEHRLFLSEAPAATVQRLQRREPEKKVVVEVGSVEEALLWAAAGADVLQLEKFSPAQVAACRAGVNKLAAAGGAVRRPLLAAAGGVRADNAAAYAAAGADLLVSSAPYTAAPRDVQVLFSIDATRSR